MKAAQLGAEKNELEKEVNEMVEARADWIVKLSAAEKELIRLRMCEKSLASKSEEAHYFEQELTKLRALGKEKDLLLSEKDAELFAIKDEVRELRYREQKHLAAVSNVQYCSVYCDGLFCAVLI